MTSIEPIVEVIEGLASHNPRVLVGIDGPDAAGKTTLADDVVRHLTVPWVRASIDGFHKPREVRVQRGVLSPEGYFRDSFDCAELPGQALYQSECDPEGHADVLVDNTDFANPVVVRP